MNEEFVIHIRHVCSMCLFFSTSNIYVFSYFILLAAYFYSYSVL